MTRRLATAVSLIVLVAGCAGEESRVVGTVVSVEGDLTTVTAFEVQTDRGRMRFVPDTDLAGFLDDDGNVDAPVTHLWDHLRDGQPVRVTYRVEGGSNIALILEDW